MNLQPQAELFLGLHSSPSVQVTAKLFVEAEAHSGLELASPWTAAPDLHCLAQKIISRVALLGPVSSRPL